MTMSFEPRPPANVSPWFAPVEPRLAPLFCLVLMAGSCALASFAFACATPFAAFFAVLAGGLLRLVRAHSGRRRMAGESGDRLWRAPGYPLDLHTLLWGFAIGVAALLATAEFQTSAALPAKQRPRRADIAIFGAYAGPTRWCCSRSRSCWAAAAHSSYRSHPPWASQPVVADRIRLPPAPRCVSSGSSAAGERPRDSSPSQFITLLTY